MRIRRSVTRIFVLSILPAVTAAVVLYFGYYAVWGDRGYLALGDTRAKLTVAEVQLDRLTDERDRLQHRIALLKGGTPDPDLVEELARTQLMDGAPGQLAVPRDKQP
jgi:cell division protein FtsB